MSKSKVVPLIEEPVVSPLVSEATLADRFAKRYEGELRYVARWGRWFLYDGRQWKEEQTLKAFDLARALCREVACGVNRDPDIKALHSASMIAAVERIAKADRRLAATIDQWDADAWILNTPAGVVDLKTGKLRPHKAEDYLTKCTAVGPSEKARCPLWMRFLNDVTAGDKDLQAFLQRVAGYALTGDVSEEALFFAYGTGGNGKGVFLNTIADIIGDYHCATPIETFTASNIDRHPTELADLRGARLVTATETEEGRRWAESRIKMLTGRDPVKARFMRQDFFEYAPQFKLLISGNHKPGLRSVDEAIRRRFNLLPFSVTIPQAERDTALREKLRVEWPAILAWMIEGCLAWQRDGLRAPGAVKEATNKYLEEEDSILEWIEEECVLDKGTWTSSAHLFGSYTEFQRATGEFLIMRKRFSQKLEERGFHPHKSNGVRGFKGLRLKIGVSGPQSKGLPGEPAM